MNAKARAALVYICLGAATALGADPAPPQIQNLVAQQRPGTYYVDIRYDLVDTDSQFLWVYAEASMDGGATYTMPVLSATGDLGRVTPGAGKQIVWNAWDAWGGNVTASAKIRLVVDDSQSQLPTPPGPAPGPNLVWIPPGTFSRGERHVWISRGFWMGKFEVTQAEYLEFFPGTTFSYPGAINPVESRSWYEATEYCRLLTERERTAGRLPADWSYRLPSEAEWEYAARAGTTTTYHFGNEDYLLPVFAWWNANSGNRPHPVGTRSPNRWGLHDVHGNVWEMCLDEWDDNVPNGFYTDPVIVGALDRAPRRGGSFPDYLDMCNSVARISVLRSQNSIYTGFRVIAAQVIP